MVLEKTSTSLPVLPVTSALCVRVMMPKVGRESKARQIEPVHVAIVTLCGLESDVRESSG